MNEITINAYAKINLAIDVIGKRADGYHEVNMVMEQIELYDKVKVEWQEQLQELVPQNPEPGSSISVQLSTNLPFLPMDSRNIAYKAAELMIKKYKNHTSGNIKIQIEKKIPVAAGLAGGSANCAAVLHALNKLWDLKLNVTELMEAGVKLGADVPFCLSGQAALNPELGLQKDEMAGTCAVASGIGEQLHLINPLSIWVLLSKPPISVSTAQVYNNLNLSKIEKHPDIKELTDGIKEKNYFKISKNMINVLESYSLREYSNIMYTKNNMIEQGKPYITLMSGSGPTVFSLYTNKRKAKTAFEKLKDLNKETFLVKTL